MPVQSLADPFPWRWASIEVLEERLYTNKSDVWSFGVLLWEIFSRCRKPYTDFDVEGEKLQIQLNTCIFVLGFVCRMCPTFCFVFLCVNT